MKNLAIYAGIILTGVLVFKINQGEITTIDILTDIQRAQKAERQEVDPQKTDRREADLREVGRQKTGQSGIENDGGGGDNRNGGDGGNPDSLTIMAFGDVMPGRYVRTLMDKYGKDYIFSNIKMTDEPFYGNADVVFANLEGPIKGNGYKAQTGTVFGFHADTAAFLKEYGFDVLSVANNHSLDQRADGQDTTVTALSEQGLGRCGKATFPDPDGVYYGISGDISYAFICFNDVIFKLDKKKALELVKQVREKVDYLIVSIHWGYEYKHTPNKDAQVDFGHELVDAGADFIIGHHPHVVQGFEKYKGKMIFYSLGNFVFDQYWSKDTQEELAIKINLDREDDTLFTEVVLFPMKSEQSRPRLMSEEETAKWIKDFTTYGDYDEETLEEIQNKIIRSSSE